MKRNRATYLLGRGVLGSLGMVVAVGTAFGANHRTSEPAQLIGNSPNTNDEYTSLPLLTIGESIDGYRAPGLLDGLGAIKTNDLIVRVYASHELVGASGYAYALANGTQLTGARISYFDINRYTRRILHAGLAFDTVVDRYGAVVTNPSQIHEGSGSNIDGMDRFCSSGLFEAGRYGLDDAIYFTGEETTNGQMFALNVADDVLYCVPQLGRGNWENVTVVDPPSADQIAIVLGDDRQGGPLWLYIGDKNAVGDGSFLDRNGLASGTYWAWKSDTGETNPEDFNGTGNSLTGTWVYITHFDASKAGQSGYDAAGYADQATLDAQVTSTGSFRFSRPEDLATNPENGTQFVFVSTGRGNAYPSDNWGDTYIVDLDWASMKATLRIIYDGDDAGAGQFSHPDFGLRSPDNLDWAKNGYIYIQEDRSTTPSSLFGGTSGVEASMWKLDPDNGNLQRVGEIDRSAVPSGQTDSNPSDLGNWEASGVIDVGSLFANVGESTLLLADVEGHSLVGESLGGSNQGRDLVEGGQLFFFRSNRPDRIPFISILDLSRGRDVSADGSEIALQASPNPSPQEFALRFDTPTAGPVFVAVFDASGRLVRNLVDAHVGAGAQNVNWDGRNDDGVSVAPGVYFARVQTPSVIENLKLTLAR